MKSQTLDKLIWPLIFVGLAFAGFGLSLRSSSDTMGWALVALGAVLIIIGIVMIFMRSRLPDQ